MFLEQRSRTISTHDGHQASTEPETSTRPPRRTRRRGGGAVALLCILSAGVAASIAVLGANQTVPSSLATPQEPTSVTLVAEQMQDSRSVQLQLTLGDELSLASPVDGRLSGSTCTAGEAISSGTSTFTVDGVPLLNLYTTTPLWRDLAFEAKGADVDALQDELIRLGQPITKTGWFDWATWNAYRKIAEDAGVTALYGELALDRVLWLPQPKMVAATCPVRLGQPVASAEALATLPTPILAASVKNYPEDLVPGERILTVDDAQIALTDDSRIRDPEALAALARTDAYRSYASNPDGGQVNGELRLVEPITVYPVPPAAVSTAGDGHGCVRSAEGAALPMRIVGSRLGRSYLAFDEETSAPKRIEARVDAGLECE